MVANPLERRRELAWGFLAAGGTLLLVVAWAHLLLIWVPTSFGVPQWEYATSTQSVDIFPLGVMGITLLSAAAVVRVWMRSVTFLGIWSALSALLLIAIAVLIALNVPVAWRSVPAEIRTGVMKTGLKAFGFALLFAAYHVWLAVRLLRSRRIPR